MECLRMLVADLDGTLIGDGESLRHFDDWYRRNQANIRLVYSSGRFIESIRESIESHRLPTPSAIIAGVGTEIYDEISGERVPDWPTVVGGWDEYIVRAVCLAHPQLTLQPSRMQSRFKISFFGQRLRLSFLDRLREELLSAGQSTSVVYSSDRDLDVLPKGIHKGGAVSCVAKRWHIPSSRVVVAGDSGNDLSMFLAGYRGIVVGNALPELRSHKGPDVFHAKRSFAAGVTEGVNYFWRDSFHSSLNGIVRTRI